MNDEINTNFEQPKLSKLQMKKMGVKSSLNTDHKDNPKPLNARSIDPKSLAPVNKHLQINKNEHSPTHSTLSKGGLKNRKGSKYSRLVTPTLGKQRRETNILKLKCMANSYNNNNDDDNRSTCTTRSRINEDTKLREDI